MKHILLVLGLMIATINISQAGGDHYFQPRWERFGYEILSAKDTIKRVKKGRIIQREKAVKIRVYGGLASDGMFPLYPLPFSVKFRTKIKSCTSEELRIDTEYYRTVAAEAEMVVPNKKFIITLPKDCQFSTKTGVVTLDFE